MSRLSTFFALFSIACATPTATSTAPVETATCVPECGDRTCGDDGCGGTCGACKGDRECSPEGTCELPCPAHADLAGDGVCECDAGYVVNPTCTGCDADTDRDGCPTDTFAFGGECRCKLGLDVTPEGCGCAGAGSFGAPCLGDGECDTGRCVQDLNEFVLEDYPAFRGAMPGGFCSVNACNYCEEWGGTCAAMGGGATDSTTLACLFACSSSDQCRDGYECRTIDPSEHFDADDAPASFCLPRR